MIKDWFTRDIFIYILLGICGLGILVKFMISMKYRTLIRASRKMGNSKNRFVCDLKRKFKACYKLNLGVNNVDTFVDKFVYKEKFCGILLYTWETISGEIIILSVLSTMVFGLLGVWEECGQSELLSTVAVGVLSTIVLIAYEYFINIKTKKKILKVNLMDFLENFLDQMMKRPNNEINLEIIEKMKKEPKEKIKKVKKAAAESENTEIDNNMEDEGTLRREAKKKELKKMIEEDKQARIRNNLENMKDSSKKNESEMQSLKSVDNKITEFSSYKTGKLQENLAVSEENGSKSALTNSQSLSISPEEAKIIEDILREYLA